MSEPTQASEPERTVVTVTLEIEVDDGWSIEVDQASGAYVLASDAGRQGFSYEIICERVWDILADATKHDKTTAWRVAAVRKPRWVP